MIVRFNNIIIFPIISLFLIILFSIFTFSYCLDSKSSLRLDGRLTKVCLRYVPDDRLNLATFVEETAGDGDNSSETSLNNTNINSQDLAPPLSSGSRSKVSSGGRKRALDQDSSKITEAISVSGESTTATATTKRRKGQPVKKGIYAHQEVY